MFDYNLCSNTTAPTDTSSVSVQTIVGGDDCLSTQSVSTDAGEESVDQSSNVFYSKKVDKGSYHSIYYANLDTFKRRMKSLKS